jgi:acid phosphatase type 7
MIRPSQLAALVAALVLGACSNRPEPPSDPLAPDPPVAEPGPEPEPEPPGDPPPPPPPDPPTAEPAVLVGAGDIAACNSDGDEATAQLLDEIEGTVITLGDNAYPDGTESDFSRCYGPSWGRHLSRTRPAPGNHDYHSTGAAPYFAYFGTRAGPAGKGYYSYDHGSWHIVALNSERSLTAQASWLEADLAATPRLCTLAYWHNPLFTSGSVHGPATNMRPLFAILYEAGADVVLSAHNHQYERFGPQTPAGDADSAAGIRYFVVGTGGAGLYDFKPTPARNSQVRYNGGYGVLKLTLSDSSYSWQFISVAGKTFSDTGSTACH